MRRLGRAGEIRKTIKLFFKKPLTSRAFCGIIVIEGKEEEPCQQAELSSKDL
jgi:hypothetical protein